MKADTDQELKAIDRWKQDASWKKLVLVFRLSIFTVVKKTGFEQKNAWSRFALILFKLHKIWEADSQEKPKNCCHQTSYFKAKMPFNLISAGTWLGELTALPRPPSLI